MKTIWIINHYAGNNEVGPEYRHFLIAKELKKNNYNVFIISSSYTHLLKKHNDISEKYELKAYDGIPYVWIKTSEYTGNGISRFKNMFSFSYILHNEFKKIDIIKPDYVICSSPHPFSIINGYYISKYYKAKFIFEERDLWPMSIVELLGVSKFNPMIMLFQWLEDFAYKKSDLIFSPLINLEQHINVRKIKYKKFLYLPNGILKTDMDEILKNNVNIDKYIPGNNLLIGFAGTIGASNCVDILLSAANKLKKYDIGFVIIGNGEMFHDLQEIVKNEKLINVHMIGKKDKVSTIKILNKCNILFNSAPKSKLYHYGLSPIKLPEYMYLEKYIINAVDIDNNVVDIADCGSTIESGNVDALANEILKLSKIDKSELKKFGKKAKKYAIDNLTYPSLVNKFISELNELN